MKQFKVYVLAALVGLAAVSCSSGSDGSSHLRYYIGLATASGTQEDLTLTLDSGTELYVVENWVTGIPSDIDGKRVKINFSLPDDEELGSKDFHAVILNGMTEILCKDPVYSSEDDGSELGTDPIAVSEAWFGGRYLNIDFSFFMDDLESAHMLNLWVDEEHENADDENIYVEFRHNAFGDGTRKTQLVKGTVSFDVTDFVSEERPTVTVHLSYTDLNGQTVSDSAVYSGKGSSGGIFSY